MIEINEQLTPADLQSKFQRLWLLAAEKIRTIARAFPPGAPTPVITRQGKYEAQGWTEWTQGFQYGAALLAFDATGDESLLEIGRHGTRKAMPAHVTHFGVHDHGFNNVSTYGNLRRLMLEGRIEHNDDQLALHELALRCSGAVQAMRWTPIEGGGGFIHSFNGPHSLFADTIRSLRSLALAFRLRHRVLGENDQPINLLARLIEHARATAEFNVYYGVSRDHYDIAGRVAHESLFNTNDGRYRCPSTQQGYSPFTTWTRGLAWVMLGMAEQLEFLDTLTDGDCEQVGVRCDLEALFQRAALATCTFYLEQTPTDGIPYWDTGTPGLANMGDYLSRPAEPTNDYEPVDSSAAAIACQALLRFGRRLQATGDAEHGKQFWQAGLTVLDTLLSESYLSTAAEHQGLLLHSIYHRPRGWDFIPPGSKIPHGESSQWGDYHLLEAALYASRIADDKPYYTFFGPVK